MPLAAKRRIWSLRRRCHAAGWAHGRVAKRPFRETCRWASPSLFFRLHGLLAPLCAYPTRFLSRCGGCATPHCLPLREKHLAPAAQLLFRLRGSLCGCDPRLRASCHAARPPRRAAFIRGSSSRHSRCGLRYKRATGTFAHAAVWSAQFAVALLPGAPRFYLYISKIGPTWSGVRRP